MDDNNGIHSDTIRLILCCDDVSLITSDNNNCNYNAQEKNLESYELIVINLQLIVWS